ASRSAEGAQRRADAAHRERHRRHAPRDGRPRGRQPHRGARLRAARGPAAHADQSASAARMNGGLARVAGVLAACLVAGVACAADKVVVGSKRFTESYILGEIVRQTLQDAGVAAEHKQGLGNTGILEQALATGSVDVYPEYTGTIVRELLKREGNPTLAQLNEWLAPRGLKV